MAEAPISTPKEIASELLPLLRVYTDGSVDRFVGSPPVPPSPEDPITSVSSKDIAISAEVSARLYLPKNATGKLPILVYFHGGGFCFESAFSLYHQRYLNAIAAEANAVAVSVEYRLAPEHLLPAAYEDSWDALQWVASHSVDDDGKPVDEKIVKSPWLADHGDFDRVFLGGDSAGANIVHNIAMRAGGEALVGNVKILGAIISQPYFWGSKPIGPKANPNFDIPYRCWVFAYPSAPNGIDNPMINPLADDAPSLAGLGCRRLLVCVAEKDEGRDRGILYYDRVRESGWKGEIELFEVKGEGHAFHINETKNARIMIERLASFISTP